MFLTGTKIFKHFILCVFAFIFNDMVSFGTQEVSVASFLEFCFPPAAFSFSLSQLIVSLFFAS